jgi:hypothetical protein
LALLLNTQPASTCQCAKTLFPCRDTAGPGCLDAGAKARYPSARRLTSPRGTARSHTPQLLFRAEERETRVGLYVLPGPLDLILEVGTVIVSYLDISYIATVLNPFSRMRALSPSSSPAYPRSHLKHIASHRRSAKQRKMNALPLFLPSAQFALSPSPLFRPIHLPRLLRLA